MGVLKTMANINYIKHNCIGCLTVVLDKELIGEFKMVNIKHEDYITWLNILNITINIMGNIHILLIIFNQQ